MADTPIEKITEHSFTATSRGLLILFIIGALKISLGINFLTNSITIPWFPTIEFAELDNVIYIYWSFVGYAVIRYCLYNYNEFSRLNSLALARQLDYGLIGNWFINKYIFDKDEVCFVRHIPVESKECYLVEIYSMVVEGKSNSVIFFFDQSTTVTNVRVNVTVPFGKTPKCVTDEDISKKFGTFKDVTDDSKGEPDETKYASGNGLTAMMYLRLYFLTWYSTTLYLFRNPKSFDVFLPVILNLALFAYWL
ncbi:hypothetical protein KW542_07330 [Vibrio fluvialis]|uniref:hypothetical protein n=1 Tax=Vibrio fluvialis TaxID=676 RepID=UPI001C9CBFC8|nr:hypothetical protein [Vibrio fluvialis]EKO3399275.1 hypothetical protein [Vibrio fluvialis]ELD1797655.1 hypothetical protein [Vibrio fluvialis]MBY7934865.1 hypothetical protein [Vibrio fluvialis]MBY8116856.1 hypothetical protein [Vibrio fluvialis]MBY8211423.1 hypothetical protein [Vibrio fluvialis]